MRWRRGQRPSRAAREPPLCPLWALKKRCHTEQLARAPYQALLAHMGQASAGVWRPASASAYDGGLCCAIRRGRPCPMPMDAKEIERLIKARFPGAEVAIKDLAGDGDHYAAHVVAREFAGKTRVQQHKMVYEALQGRMGGALHALALTTAAPQD